MGDDLILRGFVFRRRLHFYVANFCVHTRNVIYQTFRYMQSFLFFKYIYVLISVFILRFVCILEFKRRGVRWSASVKTAEIFFKEAGSHKRPSCFCNVFRGVKCIFTEIRVVICSFIVVFCGNNGIKRLLTSAQTLKSEMFPQSIRQLR
jgi:hypothetical protein